MKMVAYYRVSTQKQSQSGLGLEGQEAAVNQFAGGELVASYTEVESGKNKDRPELAKAMARCRREGATLVIAKLDRLARNVHFISGLMESGVEFVACDNPTANRLTLHILAAVAEDEARRISERTKAALAAYKDRGGVLGNPKNLSDEARRRGSEAIREKAAKAHRDVVPLMKELRGRGETLQGVADRLNNDGRLTLRGRPWSAVGVKRVLDRQAA